MKAVIGTEDDVVGFGLTGIKQRQVLPMNADLPAIENTLNQLNETTTMVFINEALLTTLRYHEKASEYDMHFTMIPDTETTPNIDEVEAIAKKTLGITP
jgi:vacuolar-type H+-ATPase subunit F/Vma7